MTKKRINEISFIIIGAAMEVHKQLGPGLLESVYHECLLEEIRNNGLEVKSQVILPIIYKGRKLGKNLKLDLLVEDQIIVEIKAVDTMIPLYKAQLLSYLKLALRAKGLLINFHCEVIRNQIVSMVTDQFAKLPEN